MYFPVSGVECPVWLPVAVAFGIALVTVPAGVSGAFILLPFQMSVLGFTAPGVTPTNLIYNIVAIPGGVYEYAREQRMAWPLVACFVAGTLPGVVAGALIRALYFPDPHAFKFFVGLVLLYLGARLLVDFRRDRPTAASGVSLRTRHVSASRIEYDFAGSTYSFTPVAVVTLALATGVIGGIYGVGGGAIIAPFLVSFFHLPVLTIAGAALFGTFLTSIAGVAAFEWIGRTSGGSIQPDWTLGLLFGLGGLAGSYLGARWQKYLPERMVKLLLGVLIATLAITYLIQGRPR